MTESAGTIHPCHRCGEPAAVQWARTATQAETKNWWDRLERQIRQANRGLPGASFTADRTGTVTTAVHGCDQHQVPGMHLLHDSDCTGHSLCACEPNGSLA